jgi:hypothetical protein
MHQSSIHSSNYLAKIFYWLLLAILIILSSWACLDIGLGWDEGIEHLTLNKNLHAIKGLLGGSTAAYQELMQYGDRYYGIGFHLPALMLGKLIQAIIPAYSSKPDFIFAHFVVLLCFLGSAYLIRSILVCLIRDKSFSSLAMLTYLLWPYLMGHGLMNVKDMPFLFAWLACTNLALIYFFKDRKISPKANLSSYRALFFLAIATSWLLSIRISGILIFIEYACFMFCAYISELLKHKNANLIIYLRKVIKPALIFGIIFIPSLILMYPISWHNPVELLHAITYMSHHPWSGTTLTAGRFIAPGDQIRLYVMAWLLAKTPLLIILGVTVTPWAIYKKWRQSYLDPRSDSGILVQWVAILISVLTIIAALILHRVGLYNELRQILFLFPLIYILGITSIYFISKKAGLIGLIVTGALFTWDNLILYPYNYTYLNEIARLRPAIQYFETDYFGFSASRSARWINNHQSETLNKCIYAYPTHLVSNELDSNKHPCLIDSKGNAYNLKRDAPALLYITQRNLINFRIPKECKPLHSEERTLPLSKNPLIMGKLFSCNNS